MYIYYHNKTMNTRDLIDEKMQKGALFLYILYKIN
jgi:hypothetical protein